DDKHAEVLPPELPLVLLRGMRSEIDAHLSFKAGLLGIGTPNRHRAAVDLDHKIAALTLGKLQAEHKVGDDAEFAHRTPVRQFRSQCKWGAARGHLPPRGCCIKIRGRYETEVAALRHSALQSDLEIDDLDLVLDERTPGLTVLPAPLR